jgi:uncharacterized protein
MRLTTQQAEMIRKIVASHDSRATVKLFGSQTRDGARGGDIDLLIVSEKINLAQRLQIEADLQDALGLRRFDIVVARRDNETPFVRLANQSAITL